MVGTRRIVALRESVTSMRAGEIKNSGRYVGILLPNDENSTNKFKKKLANQSGLTLVPYYLIQRHFFRQQAPLIKKVETHGES